MIRSIGLIALLAAAPAAAKIVAADSHGFALRQFVDLNVPPAKAYATLVRPQDWWSGDHSYSGKAARLSLDPRVGGCFCERLDGGGGVEHMRVSYIRPGEHLTLTGPIGPLLFEAVAGVLDVTITATPGGSRVTFEYRAAGFGRANGSDLAPKVDQVLGEQYQRFAAAARR
jgi:uncharacterized protein YndB with AHSA1/START domain